MPTLPRPSGAGAWRHCALYVAISAAYSHLSDQATTEVREDGTACHWLFSEVYDGRTPAIGSMSPNNRLITEDMFDACDLYLDTMREWSDCVYQVEQPVNCSLIYLGMWGTPDSWGYRPGHLRVLDLKYGFGFVEVYKNWQLTIYALAIAALLNLSDDCKVELIIVQPRAWTVDGPVRRWFTTVGELRKELPGLQQAANAAMSPNPCGTVGPWCIDCDGRIACETYTKDMGRLINWSHSPHQINLTAEQAASELKEVMAATALLEARKDALFAVVENHQRKGGRTRHFRMAPTTGREGFISEAAARQVAELGRQFYGKNLTKPLTPKQMRKQIPSHLVDAFVDKPKTAMKLVPIGPYDVAKLMSQE